MTNSIIEKVGSSRIYAQQAKTISVQQNCNVTSVKCDTCFINKYFDGNCQVKLCVRLARQYLHEIKMEAIAKTIEDGKNILSDEVESKITL